MFECVLLISLVNLNLNDRFDVPVLSSQSCKQNCFMRPFRGLLLMLTVVISYGKSRRTHMASRVAPHTASRGAPKWQVKSPLIRLFEAHPHGKSRRPSYRYSRRNHPAIRKTKNLAIIERVALERFFAHDIKPINTNKHFQKLQT